MFFIDIVTYMDIGLSKSFGLFCSYTDKLQSWKWKKPTPTPPPKKPKTPVHVCYIFHSFRKKEFWLIPWEKYDKNYRFFNENIIRQSYSWFEYILSKNETNI